MRLMSATVADVGAPARLVLSVCMFISAPSPSEARAKAEADVLRLVPRVRLEWDGIVYTNWAEGRYPLDTDAGRDSHRIAGQHGVAVDRRPAQTPQGTRVHEGLAEDADLL